MHLSTQVEEARLQGQGECHQHPLALVILPRARPQRHDGVDQRADKGERG